MKKFVLIFMLALASLAVAGMLNLQQTSASNDVESAAGDRREQRYERLAAAAQRDGSVRVLVRLNVSFTPQDTLDRSGAARQRDEIGLRQLELLQGLQAFAPVLIHQFDDVPFLILSVSEAGLRHLHTDQKVADIFEDRSTKPQAGDDAMAAEIREFTDRSAGSLSEEFLPNGAVKLDIERGFQNVPVAAIEVNGDVSTGCVASIDEANGFLGRDLETGERKPASRTPNDASRHGDSDHDITADEKRFYETLIEMAMNGELRAPGASSVTIVNIDGENEGLNDPTTAAPVGGNTGTTLGQQRLNVMTAAANIWAAFLDSNVTIAVRSQFNPLTCTSNSAVLGSAGAVTYYRDFPNAAMTQTWHPVALANKQAGFDLDGANPDMNATFNSNLGNAGCLTGIPFYLGVDNNAPGSSVNLLTTVLHEMGHGLGFISLVNGQTGALANGLPDVYTTSMYDRTVDKSWNTMTNAERLASAINSNNVLWDGGNARSASGFLTSGRDTAGRVELFTPNPFQSGSSIAHFNSRAFPNLLMEPSASSGVTLTLDLTRQQMRDIGWYRDANNDLIPDTITSVQPSGTSILAGTATNITWTNTGGFDRNVTIEMSLDGGTTFPTAIATNIPNTGSHPFTVPNILNSQVRFRVREHDFVAPLGASTANVSIALIAATPTPTPTPTPTATPTPFPTPFPELDLRISQADSPDPVRVGQPLTYTLTVSNIPSPMGGGACPQVRFNFPGGVPFVFNHAGGSNGYTAVADSTGVLFVNGCISSSGPSNIGTATLTVVLIPQAAGTLTSLGSNVVVDPANLVNETNENNNTAATVVTTVIGGKAVADFDGDGKTDLSVFRESTGVWYWQNSSNGQAFAAGFGTVGDKIVPGDYDGDGKADLAIFRPSTGTWWVVNSSDGRVSATGFGGPNDIPAQGDFDGDGKTDIAIFRPSTGEWWLNQTTAGVAVISFGQNGDKPAAGDYDGDGKKDIAVYRPSTGQWFVRGSSAGVTVVSWGFAEDKVVSGDYDGDGRTDIALYRPSTGQWFIIGSTIGVFVDSWGLATDIPVPGDYDGDGRADITVYRPSEGSWFRRNSSNGAIIAISYGINGDKPVPSGYVSQ